MHDKISSDKILLYNLLLILGFFLSLFIYILPVALIIYGYGLKGLWETNKSIRFRTLSIGIPIVGWVLLFSIFKIIL